MAYIPCFYGSVNRWECDENDHLNVRFYAQKINQAVSVYLREMNVSGSRTKIAAQHIRFVQEARIATPLRVECALLRADEGVWEVLSCMRHNLTDQPIAGFITRVAGEGFPAVAASKLEDTPDWAAPRGLDPESPYPLPQTPAAALEQGFRVMGRGVISAAECDAGGAILPEAYIGRISDGMPNLWAFTTGAVEAELRQTGELGGAALEYRLDYFEPFSSGEVLRHVSGIRAIGNKTQHMVHFIVNESRDEIAARAEAIGVAMDLQTRKAVPVSDARRVELERLSVGQ